MADLYGLTLGDLQELNELLEWKRRQPVSFFRQPNTYTRTPRNVWLAKTDAAIDKGNSGTVSIYRGTTKGSESDTTENVSAYNRFGDLESGKWVIVELIGGGWEITQGEC